MSDTWTKPYSREYAAFPAAWLRGAKFWPTTGIGYKLNLLHRFAISLDGFLRRLNYAKLCFQPLLGRVDNVYGDRNLVCTLLPVSQMAEEAAAATA